MKKKIFWSGALVLVVGVVLFAYSYSIIQNTKDVTTPLTILTYFNMHPDAKTQWDLAQIIQPIGLGILVLGAIMLAYGLWMKD